MHEAIEIANVNHLHRMGEITEAERLKRIFEIRAKHEKQAVEIITDPIEIEKAFREDDL